MEQIVRVRGVSGLRGSLRRPPRPRRRHVVIVITLKTAPKINAHILRLPFKGAILTGLNVEYHF